MIEEINARISELDILEENVTSAIKSTKEINVGLTWFTVRAHIRLRKLELKAIQEAYAK